MNRIDPRQCPHCGGRGEHGFTPTGGVCPEAKGSSWPLVQRRPKNRNPSTSGFVRLLNLFDDAAQELAFKGSQHPDDWQAIEDKHAKAREALVRWATRHA